MSKQQTRDAAKQHSKPKSPQPDVTEHGQLLARANPLTALQRALTAPPASPLNPGDILTLQRTMGNRAVQRLLASPVRRHPAGPPIQAKLIVGPAQDAYEQEADRVASQVMGQINTAQSQAADSGDSLRRQQKPEEDEQLQRKPLARVTQRMATTGDGMDVSSEVESAIHSARGGGQPLAENIRGALENTLGADFSDVKVHVDSQSDALNRSMQARAFTTGQDIFFGKGEYEPGSNEGRRLIAHELTHVVQQGAGSQPSGNIQRMVVVASNTAIKTELTTLIMAGRAREAYTLLQHFDWALQFAGGPIAMNLGTANFGGATAPLLIVQHGQAGSVGAFDSPAITAALANPGTGLPPNWKGTVFITSCFAGMDTGTPDSSVVAQVQTNLLVGRPDLAEVKVVGYTGETVTHRTFGSQIFVVRDDTQWKALSSKYESDPANQQLLTNWAIHVLGTPINNESDLVNLAAYTAAITAPIYQQMMTEAEALPGVVDRFDTKTQETPFVVIDFPQENETLTGPTYAIRIGANPATTRVRMQIDGGGWADARRSVGYWWFDWANYPPGDHLLIAEGENAQGNRSQTNARHVRHQP